MIDLPPQRPIPPLPEDRRWIRGYEGHYAVSRAGEVWSYKTDVPRLLRAYKHPKRGHWHLELNRGGYRENIYVHLAVAEAFLLRPEGTTIVKFIDGDKNNLSADNLLYGELEPPKTWWGNPEGVHYPKKKQHEK